MPGSARHIPQCAHHLFSADVVLETTPRKKKLNDPTILLHFKLRKRICVRGVRLSIVHLHEPHEIMLQNNNTDERSQVVGLWLAFEAFEEHTRLDVKRKREESIRLPPSDTQTETL